MFPLRIQHPQPPQFKQLNSSLFSTCLSPRSKPQTQTILSIISQAIQNTPTKPLNSSLKNLTPSLKPHHIINLITYNPFSLPPSSIFSFFNWISSQQGYRHSIQSYCTMAHFLCANHMFSEAQSLLSLLVSRKGKNSAYSLFATIFETKGTRSRNIRNILNMMICPGATNFPTMCQLPRLRLVGEKLKESQRVRKKVPPHWSQAEDQHLCYAWLRITADPIRGTNQSMTQLWQSILAEFIRTDKEEWEKNRNRSSYKVIRTQESLRNRWALIKLRVGHFISAVAKVQLPSGANNTDVLSLAHKIYNLNRSTRGGDFSLMHCYAILKDDPKFTRDMETKNDQAARRKEKERLAIAATANNQPPYVESSPVEDFTYSERMPVSTRPPGQKKSMALARQSASTVVLQDFLTQMRNDSQKESDADLELRRSELAHKQALLEEKKAKRKERMYFNECKLMSVDTSVMSETERKIVESEKIHIGEKWAAERRNFQMARTIQAPPGVNVSHAAHSFQGGYPMQGQYFNATGGNGGTGASGGSGGAGLQGSAFQNYYDHSTSSYNNNNWNV